MVDIPAKNVGNPNLLLNKDQGGILFADTISKGLKVNSPRPAPVFSTVDEKPSTGTKYEDMDFFNKFLVNIMFSLSKDVNPNDQANGLLIGLISKALGIENDPNFTQFRALADNIKTNGIQAVRNNYDFSNFNPTIAYEAAKIGEPVLGKNAYNSQMLELIGQHESAGDYNRVYGRGVKRIDLTNMTVDEVIAWQKHYTSVEGSASSAAGKYQIIRKTLTGLKEDMGLTGNELFDEKMQDKMAMRLLDQRGYDAVLEGRISEGQFVNNVSKEWASLKGMSGRGAYDGDGLNAGAVNASTTIATLRQDKALLTDGPSFEPRV